MSLLERFRTGSLAEPETVDKIIVVGCKVVISLGFVWLGTWLLDWHFVRGLGLFLIVCAAHVAYLKHDR